MKPPKIPGLRPSAETVGGIVFFGRTLDKIRLHAQGKLPKDYHANLGSGFDGRVCRFLHVEYPALVQRVLAGANDEEALAWCFAQVRKPNGEEILMFNSFLAKRGWRDDASAALEEAKRERGFVGREDIQWFFDFHKADEQEGRPATATTPA
jgi:gluconokinase